MSDAVQEAADRLREMIESASPTGINRAFVDRLRAELSTIRPFAREHHLTSDFELVEDRIGDLATARADVDDHLGLLETAVYGLYMSVSSIARSS